MCLKHIFVYVGRWKWRQDESEWGITREQKRRKSNISCKFKIAHNHLLLFIVYFNITIQKKEWGGEKSGDNDIKKVKPLVEYVFA